MITERREFGRRLRAVRELRGYDTQRAFAADIGIDEGTYSTYERGRSVPAPGDLYVICGRLQVTSDYLLFGDVSGLPVRLAERLRSIPELALDHHHA